MAFRPFTPDDRDWVARENARYYRDVEGFDDEFDDVLHDTLTRLEREASEPDRIFLILESGTDRAGCIFVRPIRETVARIHLFYLSAAHRGSGVGRLMLEEALGRAGDRGFATVQVSTFDRHEAACHLYRSFGFRQTGEETVTAFGQRMRRMDFELPLTS